MNATVMAIILVLIVVATVVTKKVPFNFVLFIVPIICSLLLGFSLQETSDFILEQFSSIMKSAGFMLLFAFLYFQMLTEAGVFDTIVSAVTNKLGDKMNVIVIMILTSVIAAFAILTGNFTPAYLITFPILVPLYKKYDFDREAAFIIAQTAMSAMCFIPWGIGMAYTSSSAGLSANELSKASVPWALCFIPAIVLQWVYFGIKHKKRVGTFGVVVENVEEETKEVEENPYGRPKLFWINFIILSCHQVEDKEFWTQDFQRGRTQQEYNERYYKEILDVIKNYKDYSVLGHLDLIIRYDENGPYPFEKIKPMIQEILEIVIHDGKGIEVNTSSHRYGLKDSQPSRDILKLYKELGGKIITIGSDSHKIEHLGAYIDEAKELLKEIGFDSFCTFEKMKPIFHQL